MPQAFAHSHADLILLSGPQNGWMDSMDRHRLAVGKRIVELREAKELTQPALADSAGISQPSLWSIEKGKTREVTVRTLLAVCRALDTTLDYVWFGGEDEAKAEAELLAVYRRLSVVGKAAMLQSAKTLVLAEQSSAKQIATKNDAKSDDEFTKTQLHKERVRKASGRSNKSNSSLDRVVLVKTKPDETSRPAPRIQKPRARGNNERAA